MSRTLDLLVASVLLVLSAPFLLVAMLLIRLEGGELRILTRRERVHRAWAMVTSRIGAGRSLADELIAERREEAAGE